MSKVINQRLIVLLTFVLTIFGCKKIDNNQNGFSNQTKVEIFFKSSTNLPYAVQKISLLLKEKENKFHFVEKFVKYQGLPLWQNAIINLKPTHSNETSFSQSSNVNNNDTIVKIPIQLQGAQVIHGYLLCTISSDSVSIAVIDGRTYSEYGFMNTSSQNIVAENIVTEIMSFNHTIYNLNNFNLTDTRLFADSSNSNGSRIVIFDTLNNFNGNSNAGLCSGGSTIIAVKTPDCLNTYPCTSTWCDGCNGCYKWNIHSFCNQDAPSTSSPQVLVWTLVLPEDPEGGGAYPDGWIPTPDPCPPTTGISMIICDLGWTIDYALPPFIWSYLGEDGTLFTDPAPLLEPNFQFDLSDNYESLYPLFTNMVKNLKTFVKNNPKVLTALQTYSGFSKQQILNHLTYGQGPKIKVEEMNGRFGFDNKNNGTKTLHIRASYVRGLEQSFLESTKEATAFLLAITILHEYVHLGTSLNNISEGVYDFGYGFERDAFNVIVDDNNAGTVVIKFSKYF